MLVVREQDGIDPAHGISVERGAGQLSATEAWQADVFCEPRCGFRGAIRKEPNLSAPRLFKQV
jgi:hypothetical protein